ncbi:hypothetical protein HGRIS_011815 [Hohenbuehelia grisea]|uniref:Fungal N-terminal domain-containing protein n=1 Tax=Hohenbuehelia grisea TaxID=104357 RepID=A0ABR3JWE5_9AGAR
MDPLSLAASILAFAGAAGKIKEFFSQVSENRERLYELKGSVLSGLHDIQNLLPLASDGSSINPVAQAKLQEDLDRLQRELERVHARCSKYSQLPSGSLVTGLASNIKAWIHSRSIEGDIARLDKVLQVSYIRFLTVTTVGARYAALQAAENALVNRTEQRQQMERLENAFTKMVAEHDAESKPVWAVSNISQIDMDFLLQQVRRIVDFFDWDTYGGAVHDEPPSGHHEQGRPYPNDIWGSTVETVFYWCLAEVCNSIGLLVTHSDSQIMPIQRSAKALLFLSSYLRPLGIWGESIALLRLSIELYSGLLAGFPCRYYQRCLATAYYNISFFSNDAEGLSYSQRALDLREEIYASTSNIIDLEGMILALESHARNLLRNGFSEECLNYAQQQLILRTEYDTLAKDQPWYWRRPAAAWAASGEADVVLSSQRHFIMPSDDAVGVSYSLWNLAGALASLGRYAEARVAGKDAIAGLKAALQAEAWLSRPPVGHSVGTWQAELATWISVSRGPSTRGSRLKGLLEHSRDGSEVAAGGSAPGACGADEGDHNNLRLYFMNA